MNYDLCDKELLANIACVKSWDAKFRGLTKAFKTLIDHMNLKYFLSTNRLTE